MRILHLPLLICLLWPAPLFAQTHDTNRKADNTQSQKRLETIRKQQEEEQRREAELEGSQRALQKEIGIMKSDMVRLAAEAEGYEQGSRKIETRLKGLETKKELLLRAVYGDRMTVQRLLAALQRIEANPPPALLVSPQDAAATARAGKLMQSVSLNLKLHADELSGQIDELAQLRRAIQAQQKEFNKNEAILSRKMVNIESLVQKKSVLEGKLSQQREEAIKRANILAKEADNLQDLMRRLEREAGKTKTPEEPSNDIFDMDEESIKPRLKPKRGAPPVPVILPPDTRRFSDARGLVRAPVSGKISKSYSSAHQGINVISRKGAQVVAPYSGRVEFAGLFKNYDKVMILNTGGGYFILLTGIGELYAESGEMLQAGEPIGIMPIQVKMEPNLYIEVRKDGRPVNPNPWFKAAYSQGK